MLRFTLDPHFSAAHIEKKWHRLQQKFKTGLCTYGIMHTYDFAGAKKSGTSIYQDQHMKSLKQSSKYFTYIQML